MKGMIKSLSQETEDIKKNQMEISELKKKNIVTGQLKTTG